MIDDTIDVATNIARPLPGAKVLGAGDHADKGGRGATHEHAEHRERADRQQDRKQRGDDEIACPACQRRKAHARPAGAMRKDFRHHHPNQRTPAERKAHLVHRQADHSDNMPAGGVRQGCGHDQPDRHQCRRHHPGADHQQRPPPGGIDDPRRGHAGDHREKLEAAGRQDRVAGAEADVAKDRRCIIDHGVDPDDLLQDGHAARQHQRAPQRAIGEHPAQPDAGAARHADHAGEFPIHQRGWIDQRQGRPRFRQPAMVRQPAR